ncbi:MAG: (2Fe-2S) ferredoxin domain-containing protein [Candidatus Omnitrophica bacterium]|nr:(2Fe-2S) ferredoxin domain-containing protein [Candidatus Omnitrophota bacterium]MDD5487727.1 (2Fe-2S) ferredoxin domain-containing protein [Candidatus Omnitrophota bacterium]
MTRLTRESLKGKKEELARGRTSGNWIKVGMSTCGIAAGADEVFLALSDEVKNKGLGVKILRTGCAGMCYAEPLVEVCCDSLPRVIYGGVDARTAVEILDRHIEKKEIIDDHVYKIIK